MTVKILEKEGYKFSTIGSLITIGIGIVALILAFVLFKVEGISIGKFQIFQITILVLGGLVCPGIIFTLSYLGEKKPLEFLKGKNIPLIFGITIAAIGIFLIALSGIWIKFMVNYEATHLGPAVALILCLFLAIGPLLVCIYGGFQEIMYWRDNK